MTAFDVLARLRAHAAGRPVPTGEALSFPRVPDEQRLIVAFVRMGGEALPWGVVYGRPGQEPTFLSVPEPRNRDLVAGMCARLAPVLDVHLAHPSVAGELDVHELPVDAQLWLPNGAHVDMLHLLDLRYTRARRAEPGRIERLNRLGRAAGHLFRESCRPGQLSVLAAAKVLRDLWAVPAEDLRQAHLGFALAWHGEGDATARRAAARAAEASSVGITLDPDTENEQLAPLVERWNQAESAVEKERIHARIHAVLEVELRRRFELTDRAIRLVDRDPRPENSELETLRGIAGEVLERWWTTEAQLNAGEDAFVADPETDWHPPGAASRFYNHERAAEEAMGSLVHGDGDIVRRLIDGGDAIEGRIERVEDRGTPRRRVPVWTIVSSAHGPLRLREGSKVCLVGQRGRVARILSVELEAGERRIEVEITHGKRRCAKTGAPPAHERLELEGLTVQLAPATTGAYSRNKSFGVWKKDGPGAWLTHAVPAPLPVPAGAPPIDLLSLVESLKG